MNSQNTNMNLISLFDHGIVFFNGCNSLYKDKFHPHCRLIQKFHHPCSLIQKNKKNNGCRHNDIHSVNAKNH